MVESLLPVQEMQEMGVQSSGWEDLLVRKWQPSPVFLPGEFRGQRSLANYNPWGCKESNTTEQLSVHAHSWCFKDSSVSRNQKNAKLP